MVQTPHVTGQTCCTEVPYVGFVQNDVTSAQPLIVRPMLAASVIIVASSSAHPPVGSVVGAGVGADVGAGVGEVGTGVGASAHEPHVTGQVACTVLPYVGCEQKFST